MGYSEMCSCVIFVVLAYSCWTDIRYKEIPIEVYFILVFPIGVVGLIIEEKPGLVESISMAVIMGVCFLILAVYFQGGGGDIVMMVSLSLCMGYRMILLLGIATIALFIYRLIGFAKKQCNQVPYAPFVFAGFIVERFCYYFFGV